MNKKRSPSPIEISLCIHPSPGVAYTKRVVTETIIGAESLAVHDLNIHVFYA